MAAILSSRAVALLVGTALLLPAHAQRIYKDSKYHYSLQVPAGWNLDVNDSVPILFNFPPSQAGPQGLFPDHGSEIFLIPLAEVQAVVNAKTVDEWIHGNLTRDYSAISISQLPAEHGDKAPQSITKVEADFQRGPDEELQREISYYFALRGHLFRLILRYWKDDSRAARHRAACLSVLGSIRSTD